MFFRQDEPVKASLIGMTSSDLATRRRAIASERLRRESRRAEKKEKEASCEHKLKVEALTILEQQRALARQADERELRQLAVLSSTTLSARARRLEAMEALRLADEAIWERNLETRRTAAATDEDRRRETRRQLAAAERRRLEPFMRVQAAAHDGKVDNKALQEAGWQVVEPLAQRMEHRRQSRVL